MESGKKSKHFKWFESIFKKELTCPVCLELFTNPICLPCSHTLCQLCWLFIESKQCPICREQCLIFLKPSVVITKMVQYIKVESTCGERMLAETYETHYKSCIDCLRFEHNKNQALLAQSIDFHKRILDDMQNDEE